MSVLSRIRSIQELGNPGPTRRASRPVALVALTLLLIAFAAATFYTVDTGAVSVEKTLGRVDLEEVQPGLRFRMPVLTQYKILSAKEIPFDIPDLTPKAADNLSLRDLDVIVFYTAAPTRIAELTVKYAAADEQGFQLLLDSGGFRRSRESAKPQPAPSGPDN